MAAESDDIMTIEALAEYLKISRSTLYKLVQDGRLPGRKIGKRWRFHKDAIDEWVKRGPGESAVEPGSKARKGVVAATRSGGNSGRPGAKQKRKQTKREAAR